MAGRVLASPHRIVHGAVTMDELEAVLAQNQIDQALALASTWTYACRVAAAALAALTVGAAITYVVALQTSPLVPLVLLALAVLVAATATAKNGARR